MFGRKFEPLDLLERMTEAFDVARDFDSFFEFADSMFPDNMLGLYEGDWSPRLDVYENDDAYFVKVDVPGIDQKDIDMNITNNVLTIKGEKKSSSQDDASKRKGKRYQREERIYGSFHRTVPLPTPVETDNVDAKLKDGVLYVTLPKREEAKPKKISVNVA